MQLKTIAIALAGLGIAAITPAQAATFAAGCTKEPKSAWKSIDTSAAKAVTLGYAVAKSKTTGSCHEVYATKAGQKVELFFNPVTNDLVHTEAK